MAKTMTEHENVKSSGVQTMKAVQIHEFGGPEVLRYEDAPRPQPAAGEVLVRVHAAAVNPIDWKIRAGIRKAGPCTFPLILGWDFSGVVEQPGAGVTGWKTGDEVYTRPDVARNGAYAEYIVVKAAELSRKPKTLDHIHAAAIPLAGLTAWQSLFDVGGLTHGQTVLIHAASGGVGGYAVQFAKWKGARVIGTASARNEEFVRGLGADEFIDYQKQRFEDVVHDVDLVVDTLGGDTQKRSWRVLKKGGILVSTVGIQSPEEAAALGVRQSGVVAKTILDQLDQMAQLADAGQLKVFVETVLPLSQARQAQELSQSGHTRGKIVLQVV